MKIGIFHKQRQFRGDFTKKKFNLHKKKDGQALVEFALILPILLLLVLAMIEYGWLLNAKITLNSAAREGARVAVVLNLPVAERDLKVYQTVKAAIDLSGLTVESSDVTVENKDDNSTNTHDIVVTVTGKVNPIIGLYVPDVVSMRSVARMRRE